MSRVDEFGVRLVSSRMKWIIDVVAEKVRALDKERE